MMPVGPAARANGLVGLVVRLDAQRGEIALRLPVVKALAQEPEHGLLALEIALGRGAVFLRLVPDQLAAGVPALEGAHQRMQ